MSERDVAGLLFTAEMYGVQLDQLAVQLAVSEVRARALAARWREQGYAESARLGPGRPWVWLTRDGLLACGLPYRPAPPALARLAHLRAVTAVRMALESAPGYLAAGAYWRSERRLRARMGSRVPLREHLPDGEVHWPDTDGRAPGTDGGIRTRTARIRTAAPRTGVPGAHRRGPANAGPSRRNSPARRCAAPRRSWLRSSPGPATTACLAAEARVPGAPPRHARVLYLCSPAARPTVIRARAALPDALAARVEIRACPPGWASGAPLTARPGGRTGQPHPASPTRRGWTPGPGTSRTADDRDRGRPGTTGRDVIRRYAGFFLIRGVARIIWRLLRVTVFVAAMILAAPVVLVAAYSASLAWFLGWPPRQLYRAAAWCLPMLVVWLAAMAASGQPWPRLAAAPYFTWLAMWHEAAGGGYLKAAVTVAPLAIPLGLVTGGLAWSWRIYTMETGSGGLAPSAPAAFDQRQWRHQVRTARARITAPGSVPLLLRDGSVVAGATIRTVRHPARPLAVLPYPRLRSHQVVLGTTGTGKTTLLLRLWAGFMTRGMELHAAGRASRARCSSCWTARAGPIPAGSPTAPAGCCAARAPRPPRSGPTRPACHCGRCRPASSSAPWWTWSSRAPAAPPTTPTCWKRSSGWRWTPRAGRRPRAADFLARLDVNWLAMAYAGAPDSASAGLLRSSAGHVSDVALRYRALLRRLGDGLDGPGGFGDADAWYCILEGTAEIAVAEAQARALVNLLAWFAAAVPRGPVPREPFAGARRDILLAVDEFSAVSRRLPIWQLYERARSLGLAVQVSAQSWPGLAADEDERYRVATTADGGIWLLRTPHPEPVAALAGVRRVVDTARRLLGVPLWAQRGWAHEGLSRAEGTPVVDPEIIRGLDVGQAAYIYRGGVTYVQVKRLVAGPAELAGPAPDAGSRAGLTPAERATVTPAEALPVPADEPGAARQAELGALLDEAFGEES